MQRRGHRGNVTALLDRQEQHASSTSRRWTDNEEIAEENHDEGDTDMGVVGEDESEEETVGIIHEDAEDVVSSILLNQLGQAGRSHRREFSQNYRKLVSEIYSPPRITEEIKKGRYRKLAPGFAFDLTIVDPDDGQPWDFHRRDKRGT